MQVVTIETPELGDRSYVVGEGGRGSEAVVVDPQRDLDRVEAVLAERGLSAAAHSPTFLDRDVVQSADVVITMGCGETCPIFPGKRYEDWEITDPKDQDITTVREIVDDIDTRVRGLLATLTHLPQE